MKGGGEADGGEIVGPVRAAADVVELSELEDAPEVGYPAGVDDVGADVVDELLGDQLLAVPDGVEELPHRERRGGVLPDDPKALLQLRRHQVLEPEQLVLLDPPPQPGGLDRGQPVVGVVEERKVETEPLPDRLEERGYLVQVARGGPVRPLGRGRGRGHVPGLAVRGVRAHPVDRADPLDAHLHADRAVSEVQETGHLVEHLGHGLAVGVPVDGDAVAAPAAQQLVHGQAGHLALDVPEGRVDGRDRGHGDRAAAPVAALVEELPGVLDAGRVPAEEQRADVVGEVAGHGELAPVEGGIADPGDALVRGELQGHEVAPRARDDDLGVDDLQALISGTASLKASSS